MIKMKEKDILYFINKLKAIEIAEQGGGLPLSYLYSKEFKELDLIIRIYFILARGNYIL